MTKRGFGALCDAFAYFSGKEKDRVKPPTGFKSAHLSLRYPHAVAGGLGVRRKISIFAAV